MTAGSGPSVGPGTQAGGQRAARTAAGGGAAGGCQGTVNKTFGCVPAGCQVTVQTLACPIGAAPAVLAALARQTLGLPSPVIRSSSAQNALQLTNLPTWLWINPAEWVPESKTATVPGDRNRPAQRHPRGRGRRSRVRSILLMPPARRPQ